MGRKITPVPNFSDDILIIAHSSTHSSHINRPISIRDFADGKAVTLEAADNGDLICRREDGAFLQGPETDEKTNIEQNAFIAELKQRIEKLEGAQQGLIQQCKMAETQRDKYLNQLLSLNHGDATDAWHWMGDGEDHLESLVAPILISANDLREIVAERDTACEREKMLAVHLKAVRVWMMRNLNHHEGCPGAYDEECACGVQDVLTGSYASSLSRDEASSEHEKVLAADVEHLTQRVKLMEDVQSEDKRHIEALQEKQIAETCACSHDQVTDVCMGHSPMLAAARKERDTALEREQALATAIAAIAEHLEDQWPGAYAKVYQKFGDIPAKQIRDRRDAEKQVDVLEALLERIPGDKDSDGCDFGCGKIATQMADALRRKVDTLLPETNDGDPS